MPVPRKKLRLIDVTYVEHDMFDQLLLVPRIGGGVRRKMYKEVSILDRCNIAMERTIIICRPNDRGAYGNTMYDARAKLLSKRTRTLGGFP